MEMHVKEQDGSDGQHADGGLPRDSFMRLIKPLLA